MSGVDELQAIADRIVAQAASGEQVEAYVSRDSETDMAGSDWAALWGGVHQAGTGSNG